MKYFLSLFLWVAVGVSYSQTDSSSVVNLQGTPSVLLRHQEREKPVVNNITQVVGGTVSFLSNQTYVSSFCKEPSAPLVASPGWVVTCGSRACKGRGYAGGYVSEMQLPAVRLLCLK